MAACRRNGFFLLIILVTGLAEFSLAGDGKFLTTYGSKPTNARWAAIQSNFKKNKFLEQIADHLNSKVSLPVNVPISVRECGTANAFFRPSENSITLCFELIDQFAVVFAPYLVPGQERNNYLSMAQKFSSGNDDLECKTKHLIDIGKYCYRDDSAPGWQKKIPIAEIDRAQGQIRDSLVFVLYHEAGHALASILELPVTGKEEDAVDQLAAYLSISDKKGGGSDSAANAAVAFNSFQPDPLTLLFSKQPFADEHSLGRQRFFNVLCWAYGSDAYRWRNLVDDGFLTSERASRCPHEYSQLAKSWETLLKPFPAASQPTRVSLPTSPKLFPVPSTVVSPQGRR